VNIEEPKLKKDEPNRKNSSLSIVIEDKKQAESSHVESEMEIDENKNDIPLWNRYYKLKVQESY
jgi:hypothetical protein